MRFAPFTAMGRKADSQEMQVPNDRSEPLVFTAKVESAPPGAPGTPSDPPLKRGHHRYVVHYVVPARDVYPRTVENDVGTDVLGAAVLAFDHYGHPVAKRAQQVIMKIDEARERTMPQAWLNFTQTVDLPKGWNYLYLAVWDRVTGRMGTVEAQIDVGQLPEKH